MDNLHTDITDDLDDHGNLQMTSKTTQGDTNIGLQETSKKTTRNSQVCNYGISGQVQNNESEGKIDTQGSSCMKEKKKAIRQSTQGETMQFQRKTNLLQREFHRCQRR